MKSDSAEKRVSASAANQRLPKLFINEAISVSQLRMQQDHIHHQMKLVIAQLLPGSQFIGDAVHERISGVAIANNIQRQFQQTSCQRLSS
ncbi:hypothetical protein CVS48_24600 [Achromobacter spanius]|nr:hypothetical protein CVS48_24600 [Achromobacter spanius]